MDHFTKYYSYNQVIEKHDVLIMTQQEYLTNKDNLDNPKQIVLVKREGGPKEPKMPQWFKLWNENVYEKRQPKWFQSYKKEADARFEKIEEQLKEPKMPQWFKQWLVSYSRSIDNRFANVDKRLETIETQLKSISLEINQWFQGNKKE
ncbi:MAG: hypothetical protein ACOQNY_01510 [Mycoplasmoidaceae bacterium]